MRPYDMKTVIEDALYGIRFHKKNMLDENARLQETIDRYQARIDENNQVMREQVTDWAGLMDAARTLGITPELRDENVN